ncbi:spermatogenesis-associated protein 22 isoform X2 [Pan paniscus]|uniref:spermatogenesis-associated protein 22 isoform X2 n=1 Tax=Pan paniscus TaxID=9597 RepID=UPI002436E2DD|nr:spermatogenesis-associated protein 22 isoform X2 [Pan paniscus]XP_054957343.1 spermatogenesis-associated protein 22 isoform X2 [Pan paniscus]
MKRSLNENSARSTAGCLPVPLFNQKKRNRQPLTSNPLKDDSGISTPSDNYDFPPLPTDWAWEAVNPELAPVMKTVDTGQIPHSVSRPLRSQDSVFNSIQSNTGRSQGGWSYRDGNKNTPLKTWNKNDFKPQCKRTNLVANDGKNSCPVSSGAQQQKRSRIPEPPNLSRNKETELLRQTHSSKISGCTMRGLDKNSALQTLKPNFQQNQYRKQMLDDIPEDNTLKETSLYQLQFKEKASSLRIISAVIEGVKYWREHAQKTVLLFEVLAVLDSAVTPGPYYSKTFLMRDGKNTLPCVFYEITCHKMLNEDRQRWQGEFLKLRLEGSACSGRNVFFWRKSNQVRGHRDAGGMDMVLDLSSNHNCSSCTQRTSAGSPLWGRQWLCTLELMFTGDLQVEPEVNSKLFTLKADLWQEARTGETILFHICL